MPASLLEIPAPPATGAAARPHGLRQPWAPFWAGLVLRAAVLALLYHTVRLPNYNDHFSFGWEMGRIARSLLAGRGYSDPFIRGNTGPTAWVAPLYPLLIAAVFKIFGVYTNTAGYVLLGLSNLLNALMVFPIWEIARRCFGSRVARASAWAWAVYQLLASFSEMRIWETSLTAFLFAWTLVLALRMRGIGDAAPDLRRTLSPRRWVLFGLLWGLIGLSNPSLLICLPVCGLWIIAGAPRWQAQLRKAALAALLFLVCVGPWTYRNWLAFHQFIPMRANFGAEFYMGNGPGSEGFLMEFRHPALAPRQFRLYSQMGEPAYARMRGHQAMVYVRRHPAHFAMVTLRRIDFFWFGFPAEDGTQAFLQALGLAFTSLCGLLGLALALRNRVPAAGLFAALVAVLPLVNYLVTVDARFRFPLDPLLYTLTLYLWMSAEESNRVRWFSRRRKPSPATA